jgi:hypothetical protein
MPEPLAQHTAEPKADALHLPAAAKPAEARAPLPAADHAGVYARFRQIAAPSGAAEPPPETAAALLARPEHAAPVNDLARARIVDGLQRDFGNRYVQRVAAAVPRPGPGVPVLRSASAAPSDRAPAATPGAGHPLDSGTQSLLSSRFGRDLSEVRVHDDSHAHRAAEGLGANAFATGPDIYFSRGAYNPNTRSGLGLLAHEAAHVVQHDTGATTHASGVSDPGDPLEREADAASRSIVDGQPVPDVGHARGSASIHRQAAGAAAEGGPGNGGGAAARPVPAEGDFVIAFAGISLPVPMPEIVRRARAGKVDVPKAILQKIPSTPIKVTAVTLDLDEDKKPVAGSVTASVNIPPIDGGGTLNVDKDGNATGNLNVAFRNKKIPVIQDVEVSTTIEKDKFVVETDVGFALPKVTGSLHYKYDNGVHSGRGKAKYEGAKLSGEIDVAMSGEGKASGSGKLEAELFKGLRGAVDVEISEKGDVKVVGQIKVEKQIELFPEKKYEKSFFNFERKFPLWGFVIPVIDVNVGLFAEIHAHAGFRAKFGPGVLRDIQLTGEFGTDPESVTEFGLSGEFFVPAGAEIVLGVGGGIGLGLAVADITGGIEALGVAGLYSALTVRPQFNYAGGKYTISGMAELAGVAQLKLAINAFAKVDVGLWIFKGTVWRKDWTLAEWIWNTGLNVALRANVSYTLGEDFAPDFTFETGQVDPEKLVRDVMPESGSPVPAPPKPPVPEKSTFNAEGAAGGAAGGPAPEGAAPGAPGAPAATTTPGAAGATGAPPAAGAAPGAAPGAAAPGAAPGAPPEKTPPVTVTEPATMAGEPHTLTAELKEGAGDILMASPGRDSVRTLAFSALNELHRFPKDVGDQIGADLGAIIIDADPREFDSSFRAETQRIPAHDLDLYERWIDLRLAKLAQKLADLGRKWKLKSLKDLAQGTPQVRYLPMAFRGSDPIRRKLYFLDSRWTTLSLTMRRAKLQGIKDKVATKDPAQWQELRDDMQINDDADMNNFGPEDVVEGLYAVDHKDPVGKHWNSIGRAGSDQDRETFAYDENNLRVITGRKNSGLPKEDYEHWVKPSFTSAIGNDLSLGGQPYFRDEAGTDPLF